MVNEINSFCLDAECRMNKCIEVFKLKINKLHIGRVTSNMLDNIKLEYYGVLMPLSQLSNIVVENARTLSITVFDSKMIKPIEKAIFLSNLELTSMLNGNVLHIILPVLTEERRDFLVKKVRSESEKSKISIRNVRRIINDKVKNLFKNKKINTDDEHYLQDKIQKLTDIWIKKVDIILMQKESELMRF